MTHKLLLLPGDGIGVEVMGEVERLIEWLNAEGHAEFNIDRGLVGGSAYDKHGKAISEDDMQKALAANDLDQAGRLLNDLSGEHAKSGYTQQGRLLLAKRDADEGKFDEAIKHLREVVDTSADEELGQVARLRLARLLIQTGKHDEALQLLNVEKAGAFAAQVREIRGDALVAKGDAQGARAEYAAALAPDAKGQVDRPTVELKLRDVGGEVPAAPVKPAAAAAKGDS